MKHIYALIIMVMLLTVSTSAQSIYFKATRLTITELSTNQKYTENIDMGITITDYYVTFSTGRRWTVTSDVVHISDTSFYVYANDDETDSRCRIWIKVFNKNDCTISFEYNDYLFVYNATRK